MNKLRGDLFWVLIGLALAAELAVYVVGVRGKASANRDRIEELGGRVRALNRLEGSAARQEVTDAARKQKQDLQREYARMVLLLIGKDDLLDRFGPDVGISPVKAQRLNDKQKTKLKDFLWERRRKCVADALALGMALEKPSPWDFIELEGRPPPEKIMYAYKQLWVQQALLDIMKQPAPHKPKGHEAEAEAGEKEEPAPLATMLNKIEFEVPEQTESFDPDCERFVYYRFNVDVSMPAANVPFLLERILKHELPLVIESYAVSKALDKRGGSAGISRTAQKLVNVLVECKVLDFTMGVTRVVFSPDRFEDPDGVSTWLQDQTDDVAKVIHGQITKEGVSPRVTDRGFEYAIYADSMLTSEPVECEIYDGVTVQLGSIRKNVPDMRRPVDL